jgi:mRNA-degrading endonuclease RelE of RelBE toxin-antitoxin system
MAYNLLYFDEVLVDVQQAKAWYKEKREGLEKEFACEIEVAIEKLKKMPSGYSIRYKNIRIIHTKVFPYNIHYYVDELNKTIVIIGIVHKKRLSEFIGKRI